MKKQTEMVFLLITGREQRNRIVIKPEQKQRTVLHQLQREVPNILECNNFMEIPGKLHKLTFNLLNF